MSSSSGQAPPARNTQAMQPVQPSRQRSPSRRSRTLAESSASPARAAAARATSVTSTSVLPNRRLEPTRPRILGLDDSFTRHMLAGAAESLNRSERRALADACRVAVIVHANPAVRWAAWLGCPLGSTTEPATLPGVLRVDTQMQGRTGGARSAPFARLSGSARRTRHPSPGIHDLTALVRLRAARVRVQDVTAVARVAETGARRATGIVHDQRIRPVAALPPGTGGPVAAATQPVTTSFGASETATAIARRVASLTVLGRASGFAGRDHLAALHRRAAPEIRARSPLAFGSCRCPRDRGKHRRAGRARSLRRRGSRSAEALDQHRRPRRTLLRHRNANRQAAPRSGSPRPELATA